MKKLLFVLIIFLQGNFAYAIPNYWVTGFGQGYSEYSLTNENNKMIIISCNVSAGEDRDHSVFLYNGETEVPAEKIEMLSNDQVFYIPSDTFSRTGSEAWFSFINEISSTGSFDIYVDDKLFGKFSPKNTKKVLHDMNCSAMIDNM